MAIDLLLMRHREQRPFLEQPLAGLAGAEGPPDERTKLEGQTALERRAKEEHGDGFLRDDAADPQDLAAQGWGIVITDDERGEQLLSAIHDLRQARQAQQGFDVTVYRVKPGMDAREAARWKNDVYWNPRVSRKARPRYLLVLGDLDGVSLEFQQMVGLDTYMGRLAFSDLRAYGAYVEKILQWEKKPESAAYGRAMFYTVRDSTNATNSAHRQLVKPLCNSCTKASETDGEIEGTDVSSIPFEYGQDDPISPVLNILQDKRPGVFFSASHGLGAPLDGFETPALRRNLQGAMCFGNGKKLTGAELVGQTFLPGGVWFMLACYGAATPAKSAYYEWLRVLKENDKYRESASAVLEGLPGSGEKPFVAALPQAVLANPQGPIAVISHADLAWTFAFEDVEKGTSHTERFEGLVKGILKKNRIGTAFHDLYRFWGEKSSELLLHYEPNDQDVLSRDPIERSLLWLARNDIAGYMLLGDPAARLPLAGTAPKPAKNLEEPSNRVVVGAVVPPIETTGPGIDERKMEQAVIAVLAGESVAAVAARLRVDRDKLPRWVSSYREAGLAALRKYR
ncbi:MAG TPA: helix-turn-helix domain-containing protein [Polyangium sp.]|nr:helix-turn-helix domain-containing protein [Polyangium sp.]